MRKAIALLACALLVPAGAGAAAAKKRPAASKSKAAPKKPTSAAAQRAAAKKPSATASRKTASSKRSSTRSSSSRRRASSRSSSRRAPQSTWRNRQTAPTPERYRDIQQALIEKGYLDGVPTGRWDAASVEALRRFQQSQNLQPTGKIDSLSLIALGLGPRYDATLAATPPAPVPQP